MEVFYLVKQGYGSLKEIRELDTDELLDLIEYEQIKIALEKHYMKG